MNCRLCNEEKPLENFVRNRSRKSGYEGICKQCHRERQKRYYAEDPERIKARIYSTRDPRRHLAYNLRWAAENPEKANAYKTKWARANPENVRDRVRKRRSVREAAFVAEVRFNDILLRDAGVCGICGEPIMEATIELDHIVPLAAGGTHEPNNVQLAHRTCNRRKHARVDFTLASTD